MPILMVTPERMAETWLGALACAEGSQMCSGKMPALSPNPASASQKRGDRTPARGRVGVRGGQRDVQRKNAGLESEPGEREPEQRREVRMVAERTKFPTARARREQREKCKEAKRPNVRRREIQTASAAPRAFLALQRDEKIRAHGVNFPRNQKVQPVRRNQDEAHAEEQSVPPCAARRGGNGMLFVRPIFARIQTARATEHGHQVEK